MFEVVEERAGIMTPKYNLEPPHYDGIQSMCIHDDTLFSGSRDMCIKKWDLSSQQLKHVSHVLFQQLKQRSHVLSQQLKLVLTQQLIHVNYVYQKLKQLKYTSCV
jgi:kinesin family protein 4/21/27